MDRTGIWSSFSTCCVRRRTVGLEDGSTEDEIDDVGQNAKFSSWVVCYGLAHHSTVQYSTVQYSAVQYSTVQYSTVQYSTVQCSTAFCVLPGWQTRWLYRWLSPVYRGTQLRLLRWRLQHSIYPPTLWWRCLEKRRREKQNIVYGVRWINKQWIGGRDRGYCIVSKVKERQEGMMNGVCALPAVMTSSMTSTRRPFIAAPTNWPPWGESKWMQRGWVDSVK